MMENVTERTMRELWEVAMSDDPDQLSEQEVMAIIFGQLYIFGPADPAEYPCPVEIQVPTDSGQMDTVECVITSREGLLENLQTRGIEVIIHDGIRMGDVRFRLSEAA